MVHRNLIIIVFLFSCFSAYPQKFPDTKVHLLLKSGTDNIINQNYEAANNDFQELSVSYPELPLGDIYLAALEITKSYDLGIKYEELFIKEKLSSALIKTNKLIEQDPRNIWYQYFAGIGKGYTAYFNAIRENWLGALSKGMDAVEYFEKCLFYDSTFYESYIAIGTFEYWKSSKLGFLSWLPFINDNKEKGIELLSAALNNAEYNNYLAANSLIWIYIDLKKYDSASEVATRVLKDYPDSRIFKWGLARSAEESDPQKAIQIYKDILFSFQQPSLINEVTLKHKIAQLEYILNNRKAARKLCEEILSKKIEDRYSKEVLELRLERVNQLYQELND